MLNKASKGTHLKIQHINSLFIKEKTLLLYAGYKKD